MSHDATPNLDFAGTTPYEDYVQADVLTHLQHPLSEDPGEMVFLVTTQVMELWFTVIVHEWETATRALREDRVQVAMDALKRSVRELEALNASWKPLGQLTPAQFNSYRSALGEGSGFQSAMYRRMEFLLGDKSASMLVPAPGRPAGVRRAGEGAARAEPVRRGAAAARAARAARCPRRCCERDLSAEVRAVARGRGGLGRRVRRAGHRRAGHRTGAAGEALTDVGELVWRWRNDHLVATRRAMGSKTGTGGSAGVAWLEKRARKNVFPELWTARSHV